MKKLIALILCMLLAAAPMAMAEGCDLTIGNMRMTAEGTEYVLDGVELVLSMGQSDDGAGLRIAVNANGESVADLALQLAGDKIIAFADGVSDIYSIDTQVVVDAINQMLAAYNLTIETLPNFVAEMITKLAAEWSVSIEKITAVIAESVTEDGTVEIDGETAAHYVISISEDGMQTIIDEVCARLGDLMTLIGQTDAAQQIAYIADSGVHFSLEGTFDSGETKVAAEIRLNVRDEATDETETMLITETGNYTEADGVGTMRIEVTGALETENGMENVIAETIEVYEVNGDFAGFEITVSAQDSEPIVIKLDMPARQADGMVEFSIRPDPQAQTEFNVQISDTMARVALTYIDSAMSLTATQIADNAVNIAFEANVEGSDVSASLDAAVTDGDASWLLPTADDTVDVLSMDQAQMQKLMSEASVKAMDLLGTLAGASEELAALVADGMN